MFEPGSPRRALQRDSGTVEDYANDLWLFFGIQFAFFVATPLVIALSRLLIAGRANGLLAAVTPPVGRVGAQRTPASALRFLLFELTPWGYYMDLAQAAFSAISCLMFIAVAYSSYDPVSVQDIEFFFTCYFFADYCLRLYIAQDSLAFFFSGVSLLDFVTVVPAIVTWLMSGLTAFETDVQLIVQCIRVMRVFRIFRVIRVIRVISVNQSFAFQRQVFVLVMTVLSLVFAAAGLFQIFESAPGREYPFHKAVYYAAITVIGRPGVPFTATVTAVFLTVLALSAATIIPTFVAELIRLWYDNSALDWYTPNPEAPHVIVCGDTNASRLRVLVTQYFHPSRDPNELGPVVILAEGKPEGALRALLEQYKHSGAVQYVRGSGRRAADLRRAAAAHASAAIVLNYRADKDAGTADTEVLSTVMAIKSVKPGMRVLAQLHRPRKRTQLQLVPGWGGADRAFAAHALGMTMVGVGAYVPGFPTLVTQLLRRDGGAADGGAVGGARAGGVVATARAAWATLLRGEAAGGAHDAARDVDEATGRLRSRTPADEYADSMANAVYELGVTPGLAGRTFSAAARVAYLRYGVTLIGSTVPVDTALRSALPTLPRAYRAALVPLDAVLTAGMRLFAIARSAGAVARLHAETGGHTRTMLERASEDVKWLPFDIPGGLAGGGTSGTTGAVAASGSNAAPPSTEADAAAAAGGAGDDAEQRPAAAAALGAGDVVREYAHNAAAATDIDVGWCWHEHDLDGGMTNAFLSLLHVSVGGGSRADPAAPLCESCRVVCSKRFDAKAAVTGSGVRSLNFSRDLVVAQPGVVGFSAVLRTSTEPVVSESSASPVPAVRPPGDAQSRPSPPASDSGGALRRQSLGDDGFGGIDDLDDIVLSSPGGGAGGSYSDSDGTAALSARLALPLAAQIDGSSLAAAANFGASTSGALHGHVLICGASDHIGMLLRALASIRPSLAGDGGLDKSNVVILAPSLPAEASINAIYAGSAGLLRQVTHIVGSAADPSDLRRAGALTARSAIILTSAKPTVSADGNDNLSDDTEAIMITSVLHAMNPALHVCTELLHGGHAPFVLPVGATLVDAQRHSFSNILSKHEATRLLIQLDVAANRLSGLPNSARALQKVRQQQQHLRARFGFHVGDGASPTSSVVLDGIRSGGLIGGSGTRTAPGDEGDAARFAAAASTADIVDVLVGVREDFSAAAGEGGSASSSGGLGAGSGVGAGASKGSGATSDLFSSPAFASGRVFSFATLDGLLTEAHFAPHTVPVIKQLIRAARLHRLFLLPVADAVTMARVAASVNRHAGARDARAPVIAAAALERARAAVASEAAARAVPRGDGAAPPTSGDDAFDRYGLLFEALLRAWRLLPIGLYRRVHPASGLRVPREAAAAVAAAVGPPPPPGALFAHAHTAVSYVVVNALPDTVLSPHDYVYVMSGDDEED